VEEGRRLTVDRVRSRAYYSMRTPNNRDGVVVGFTLDQLLKADPINLARLARAVGASIPKDTTPKGYHYRLACNILRAIKRG
jgi:hypothetical protein